MPSYHELEIPPFEAHPLLRGGRRMTAVGNFWPRRPPPGEARERLLRVDAGTQVLALIDGETAGARDVLVCVHGLTGSATSRYMVGTAAKAARAGIPCVRMNVRNCGNTEHLTRTAYHGGLTDDVQAVAEELVRADGVERVHLAGFSIGGNMVLKLAAELGDEPPPWLAGVVAVSPCIDFAASADALNQGVFNRLCQRRFLTELRSIVRRRHAHDPDRTPLGDLDHVRTIRAFDERFTAPLSGFDGADDYYRRASVLPLLDRIRVRTLVLAAEDDPLVPFASFRGLAEHAPTIRLVAPAFGGHTAFLAARTPPGDLDRLWAENRIVQAAAWPP